HRDPARAPAARSWRCRDRPGGCRWPGRRREMVLAAIQPAGLCDLRQARLPDRRNLAMLGVPPLSTTAASKPTARPFAGLSGAAAQSQRWPYTAPGKIPFLSHGLNDPSICSTARLCRIEGVVVAHIYPCIGILTYALPALWASAVESFPIIPVGNQIAD